MRSIKEMDKRLDEREKEIERLEKRNKEIYEGFMATQEELKEYAEENERLNNIIDKAIDYIDWRLEEHQDMYKYQMEELLEILDKEGNVDE